MTPFEIDPSRIAQLNNQFSLFIAHLLEIEQGAHDIVGYQFNFNSSENIPDGGVDASFTGISGTEWLPAGDSAWQFKQSNPGPKACADELEKASWVHEYLKKGGHYVMVQGRQLTDETVKSREKALRDKAVELGLIENSESDYKRIRVYDANHLARWGSKYPALTLDPILNMPFASLTDYGRWSKSRAHQYSWIDESGRSQISEDLVKKLKSNNGFEFRVEGTSGVGKTRLVMNALKDATLSKLVVYSPQSSGVTPETINYLDNNKRIAILVVDECDRHTHEKLAEQLTVDSKIHLISIGYTDTRPLQAPIFMPGLMTSSEIEEALKTNKPGLWVEARRFVSERCGGNIRMAYIMAERLIEKGAGQAAILVERGDLETILSIVIPEDQDFLLMATLALFERIGWEGEPEEELHILAEYCGTDIATLKQVGARLDQQELFEGYGRYRGIGPNPVAVYLAAKAWDKSGQRIVDELLPKLNSRMMAAFFARVADLGRYTPASSILEQLLAVDGLFGSLESIESHGVSEFLVQLAIVTPKRTIEHIGYLISEAEREELRQREGIRRNLVRALEKIAWHTNTFREAAGSLLQLSLAENESYANNATGAWTALFGMALPATAALPQQRMDYLSELIKSPDSAVRKLLVSACGAGLSFHESVMVSAELQQGASVEPRGSVRTYQEAADYGKNLILILSTLADDRDDEVAKAAFKALTDRLHPKLANGLNREDFRQAIINLGTRFNKELRSVIEKDKLWASRTNAEDFVAILEEIADALPKLTSFEELEALAGLGPWEFREGSLMQKLDEVLGLVLKEDGLGRIIDWLSEKEVSSAWMIGESLANNLNGSIGVELLKIKSKNLPAIAGFLNARIAQGEAGAFDVYLDASKLDTKEKLFLTMRGPSTEQARIRAVKLALTLPPHEGAWELMSWGYDLELELVKRLLVYWQTAENQKDYNAIVDWLAFWMHDRGDIPSMLTDDVWVILQKRIDFPEVGNESWDWCELARKLLRTKALGVTNVLLELVVNKDFMLAHQEEARLLTDCLQQDPANVWLAVVSHLNNKDDWRIVFDLQGWFIHQVPFEVVANWIGSSLDKARIAARLTDPGDEKPTELGRFLLNTFPDDEKIIQSLNAQYWNDGWSGNWSDHLKDQISQLESWVRDEGSSTPSGKWARNMIGYLRRQLKEATLEEQERTW